MIWLLENIVTNMAYECSRGTYLIQIRWFCEHPRCWNVVALGLFFEMVIFCLFGVGLFCFGYGWLVWFFSPDVWVAAEASPLRNLQNTNVMVKGVLYTWKTSYLPVFMKYTAIWFHAFKRWLFNHICTKYGWSNIIEGGADCMFTILVQQCYFLRQWSENILKSIISCKPHIDRNIGVGRGKM